MRLDDPEHPGHPRIAALLAHRLQAEQVEIINVSWLRGGAVQENWRLDVLIKGQNISWPPHFITHLSQTKTLGGLSCSFVLRCNAKTCLPISHTRAQEYILLSEIAAAGLKVPQPILVCTDLTLLGSEFFIMTYHSGTADGVFLSDNQGWKGDRAALGRCLGKELARLHQMRFSDLDLNQALAFLPSPGTDPAATCLAALGTFLDQCDRPFPVLRWGLAWLTYHKPPSSASVLLHRDFRTGNYLVDKYGLTAILDWEFSGWGDPHEDIGWFCARCWRFSNPQRAAGGVAARADFYEGYETEIGKPLQQEIIGWWEILATLRWASIAIQQAQRGMVFLSDPLLWKTADQKETAKEILDLLLTGRRIAELSWDILIQTALIEGEEISVDSFLPVAKKMPILEWPSPGDLMTAGVNLLHQIGSDQDDAMKTLSHALKIVERETVQALSVEAQIYKAYHPFICFLEPGKPERRSEILSLERRFDSDLATGKLAFNAKKGGITLRHAFFKAIAARLALSNPDHFWFSESGG